MCQTEFECAFCTPASYICIIQSADGHFKMKWHEITNSIAIPPLSTLFEEYVSLEGLIHKSTYTTVSRPPRFTERGARHVSWNESLLYGLLRCHKTFARKAVELSSRPPLFLLLLLLPPTPSEVKFPQGVVYQSVSSQGRGWIRKSHSCATMSKMCLIAQQSVLSIFYRG